MNVHFFLSDKGRKKTSIILTISHRGKYYRKSTGLSATTAQWSISKEKSGHAPTDKVERIVPKGARHIRQVVDKFELVSSHTFRRSAATNLYLQGVPLRSIMQLAEHSSIAMPGKCLKVSGEENASRLADLLCK